MSVIKVGQIQTPSGVNVYSVKGWLNFNGAGTIAIRGSGNISSIVDAAVGAYGVVHQNAYADVNYAWGGIAKKNATATYAISMSNGHDTDQLTNSLSIETITSVRVDCEAVELMITR